MAKVDEKAFVALKEMLDVGMIVSFEDPDECTVYPDGHSNRKQHHHFGGQMLVEAIMRARKAMQKKIDEIKNQPDIGG